VEGLTVVTWLWGSKYNPDDVAKLAAGIKRHLKQPHRLLCVTDRPLKIPGVDVAEIPMEDRDLLEVQGCFARLRMFDPAWQADNNITRWACVDLDTVIVGPLDPTFDRPEPFVILKGGNFANPCPYGGALMMLRAGHHAEVWRDFSLTAAGKVPFYSFPDDQGWIWHKIPDAAGWKCGPESGVYVFRKPGWPKGHDTLPNGARLVTFNGWRSPAKFKELNWVQEYWR
jgi:hypothetical protein